MTTARSATTEASSVVPFDSGTAATNRTLRSSPAEARPDAHPAGLGRTYHYATSSVDALDSRHNHVGLLGNLLYVLQAVIEIAGDAVE
ncbi:MAG TPA: hypothetical protein VFW64_04550 [Pseudonocardiaceae bacterium]|nr:hypothetical protein [Pseudonocardiaceae bacterium]